MYSCVQQRVFHEIYSEQRVNKYCCKKYMQQYHHHTGMIHNKQGRSTVVPASPHTYYVCTIYCS